MTERDFWVFLNNALARGREPQISGTVDCEDPQLKEIGRFIGGHSFLPKDYNKIPIDQVIKMGGLLFSGMTSISTKEAILVLLAHHPSKEALSALRVYNEHPDIELKLFAGFALDECEMWNEQ